MDSSEDLMPSMVNVADLRLKAKKRLPKMVFDYIDGGSDDEVSLRRNSKQFDTIAFEHRVFVDVAKVDQSVELFGHKYDSPICISPTGLAGLAWPKAEIHLVKAAAKKNIPFCLSVVSSVGLEDVGVANDHPKWFQLYIFRDKKLSKQAVALLKNVKSTIKVRVLY